jgi:hypothetical protein
MLHMLQEASGTNLMISDRVVGSICWIYRESTQGVELKAPGVGFEPPWFSPLGWMNSGSLSFAEPLESDKLLSFMNNARLTLNS